MKPLLTLIATITAAAFAAVALAKETGTTRAEVELKTAPYTQATSHGRLAAGTRIELVERRGAWIQVSAGDQLGWLRMHQVRLGEGEAKQGASGFFALWKFGTAGRSSDPEVVVITGVRGMSAEQLKDAKPNPDEEKKLHGYRASDAQARDFANAAGLKEQDVAALPRTE